MKKILALAVGMLLIPFTAFGMQMMSDSDMDSITGQSGVAISLSNVQIYSSGGDDLWYETSVAVGGSTQAVGLLRDESGSYTFINAIADARDLYNGGSGLFGVGAGSNAMLRGDYGPYAAIFTEDTFNTRADYGARLDAAVLSIRVVDNANSVFRGKAEDVGDEDFAAIEIGLPTLEIYNPKGSYDVLNIVITGAYTGNPISGFDKSETNLYTFGLGTIYTGGESTTAILGGRVGITSYGQIDDDFKTYSFTVSDQ